MILPKSLKFILKLIVSLSFVAWLVLKVNWEAVLGYIQNIQPSFLILYIFLLVAGIFISAAKWQTIAAFKSFHQSLRKYFSVYLIGTFINNFLPSFIGGDTYRAYWLGKKNGQYSPALSTVIFDRYTGLWAAMILTLFFSLFHVATVLDNPLWLGFDALILLWLCIDGIYPTLLTWRWVRKQLLRLPEKFQRLIQEVQSYYRKEILVPALFFSLVFNFVGVGLANFVLFQALGESIAFTDYMAVIFLVSIVSSLPISINNIGLKEWAYFTFFGFLGANPEAAITVAIVSRFIQMLVSFFALPAYIRSKRAI